CARDTPLIYFDYW
nr:immunoglobulin heavy chain junction region [Mus musculus]MBK4184338.1 immunoglobulin heavy chain junction region [Mus musculus]